MLRWFKRKESEAEVSETPTETAEGSERQPPLVFLREPPTAGAWLEVEANDGQRFYLPLTLSTILLGSAPDCDGVLTDETLPGVSGVDKVSPHHARVEQWKSRWVIVPLSTEAAVFVNGRRTGENALRDGMEITLGENGVRFTFRCVEEPSAS